MPIGHQPNRFDRQVHLNLLINTRVIAVEL